MLVEPSMCSACWKVLSRRLILSNSIEYSGVSHTSVATVETGHMFCLAPLFNTLFFAEPPRFCPRIEMFINGSLRGISVFADFPKRDVGATCGHHRHFPKYTHVERAAVCDCFSEAPASPSSAKSYLRWAG